ncbi:winged helix-turn-helix transcriptional regulator [Actinomadura macrotermitis]|uniref:Putative HTH-type transcriptional regulator n=1 Tax=Actinomadura macrotermitis TaxID=2585200 RepID=A0A7K0C4V3_9ACTN|nr:helix-turn-helix domain-containing protein [Actinomadura macrotermitis]MQY08470.1 putative HTH-type transcriptional regulator [Actinomadura macrotermitis]
MALGKDYRGLDCSLSRSLEVVGERWTLLIVRDACYGVRRFSDFQAHLEIPRAVLSARLTALVDAGVLAKEGHEYAVTEVGRQLWPVIHLLLRWGADNFAAGPCRVFRHVGCGEEIGPDGGCAACGRDVSLEELEIHPGPGLDPRRDDPVSRALREPHRMLEPIRP